MDYVKEAASRPSLPELDSVECVVVGGGIVGLAVARALATAGREVLIAERHDAIGTETSSRNSEVVHAGLHYPPGSLKAVTCVMGRQLLYDYCDRHGVPYRRCGKLIVATSEAQVPNLEAISSTAVLNGVDDLELLDRASARALEPALECVAALHSPSTGIVDTHALMLSLLGEAEQHGAMLALCSPVQRLTSVRDGLIVECGEAGETALLARHVINCAGLGAVELASNTVGLAPRHVPRAYFAKGNYFSLSGRAPFTRLVYPVPEPGGLGVHLTLDLAGQARFGPDVEWVESIDYSVDASRCRGFDAEIRKYWPALPEGQLVPAYAGIRPKIVGPGETAADFRIEGPEIHGIAGLVNMFGIESPGLTAALSLGEHVAERIAGAAFKAR